MIIVTIDFVELAVFKHNIPKKLSRPLESVLDSKIIIKCINQLKLVINVGLKLKFTW